MNKIDKIYYINLDSRLDRLEQFTQQINTYFSGGILEARVERFPAIQHSHGLLGCSMSHLEVIKKAKTAGSRYTLVFEDDFEFIVSRDIFETNINNFFNLVENNNLDFKVAMLAYNANNHFEITNNDTLETTTDVQTCAGYLINSKYYDELIQCWEQGIQLYQTTWQDWIYGCDQYWKKLQHEKWYIFKTRIGKQRAGYSDCGKRFIDYNC